MRIALLSPLLCLTACAVPLPGTLGPKSFQHEQHGYEFVYTGQGAWEPMGPDWRFDSYVNKGTQEKPRWNVRAGSGYSERHQYDLDDDGVADVRRLEATYDLRFTHREHDGVIWIRTLTLSSALKDKRLDVLSERYVDSLSGGFDVNMASGARLFGEGSGSGSSERRFGAHQLGAADCKVAGVAAHQTDYVESDVDRAHAGDAEASKRVRMMLIDPGYKRVVSPRMGQHRGIEYKVVLLAVYTNRPNHFDEGLADFDTFLNQLSLGQGLGEHTCTAEHPHERGAAAASEEAAVEQEAAEPEPEDVAPAAEPAAPATEGGEPSTTAAEATKAVTPAAPAVPAAEIKPPAAEKPATKP